MSRHPLIGVAYDVQTDDMPKGIADSVETMVPVGYDDTGNLRVDHYGREYSDDGTTLLWNEDGFRELVHDGVIVE